MISLKISAKIRPESGTLHLLRIVNYSLSFFIDNSNSSRNDVTLKTILKKVKILLDRIFILLLI